MLGQHDASAVLGEARSGVRRLSDDAPAALLGHLLKGRAVRAASEAVLSEQVPGRESIPSLPSRLALSPRSAPRATRGTRVPAAAIRTKAVRWG